MTTKTPTAAERKAKEEADRKVHNEKVKRQYRILPKEGTKK